MAESTGYVNTSLSSTDATADAGVTGSLPEGRHRSAGQRFVIGVLAGLLLCAMVLGTSAFAWQRHYAGRIAPGVWVAGVPLEGLTPPEAQAALQQAWDSIGPRHLTLRDGDRQWVIPLDALGIGWDLPATVRAAMAVGHSGSLWENWRIRLSGLREGVAVPPLWTLDEARCNLALRQLAQEIDQPPRSATLELGGAFPQSQPAIYGRELDVDATREKLRQSLATGLSPVLELEIRSLAPTVVDGEAARERAEKLLSRQVVVTFGEDGTRYTWALGRETIAAALKPRQEVGSDGQSRWVVDLDPAPIAAWVQTIADQIDRPVVEGRVRVDPKTRRASITIPSRTGWQVDTEEALNRVLAALEGGSGTVELPVEIQQPNITADEVAHWGPLNLLSEGVSYFKGSDPGRKQNIVTGSSRYDGVVVPAGATFSFNRYIGPITLAEGWAEAYVIMGDRTELGAGGGICQVATTCFRAAFFGGFPIVERFPHPYRVSWYEPPVGLDATVYTPWTDFKFRNDLSFPIVIQTEPNTTDGVLTFRFYGPGELGRTVEMEGPHVDRETKAPPPIYEDDPTLEPGEVKQVDWAHDGLRAIVYRIIKQGDTVIARERFVSEYKAWPARFKRGPQP